MTVRSFPGRGHLYDVMIVGAGISGSEAAMHCARAGLDTLLITTSLDTVYNLLGDGVTLNPPQGSLMAKLVNELAPEHTHNTKSYVSNWHMHRAAKQTLELTPGIHLLQSSVSSLLVEDERVLGVRTWEGVDRLAKTTALCVGSFLHARLRIGELTETAGRLSEMAYDDLHNNLVSLGFTFEPLTLQARFEDDSLPYDVSCQVFAASEKDATTHRLTRLESLFAAGVVASGYVTFEAAALEGMSLGQALVAASGVR